MSDIIWDVLTERIRNKMSELDLNQAQLAKKAKITPAALSQILSKGRKPSGNVLRKIAIALGESVDYIIGDADHTNVDDLLQHKEFQTFYRDYSGLSENDKEQVKNMMELLRSKSKKK